MANLSELVTAIAEAEGMDPASVSLIARYVREAGFIRKKGRGTSAASMDAKDAANLLIAINASSSVREAPAVVPVYRNLIAEGDASEDFPETTGTFGEALEQVIKGAIDAKLPPKILSKGVSSVVRAAFEQRTALVSVTFKRPDPAAELLIRYVGASREDFSRSTKPHSQFRLLFFPRPGYRRPQKMRAGDRIDITEIGNATIFSVASTLDDGP
jgi:hypothetical protein